MRPSLRVVLAIAAAAVTSIPALALSSLPILSPDTPSLPPVPSLNPIKLDLEPDVLSLHAQRDVRLYQLQAADSSLRAQVGATPFQLKLSDAPQSFAAESSRGNSVENDAPQSFEADSSRGNSVESEKPARLRRLPPSEITTALVATAQRLIRQYHERPLGTEFPIEQSNRHYVAKIEVHYHPEGGSAKPWGYHKGISLFVADNAAPNQR